MPRFILVTSAIAFVGIGLAGAIADQDVRAVYGGLQIGVAVFLLMCAAQPDWFRPGLVAQILFFCGLALARVVSLLTVGTPGPLGVTLHAAEIVALVLGLIALRRLRSTA